VGSYPANAYALHDMAGNVWEWVSDWYAPNYYARAQYINPQGPEGGLMRIVRGGAWVNADARYLRCAYRHKVPPDTYAYSIGFRIAYSLK
jgi:formylglycine-generating enzyme required for sulfatase activity